MAFLRILGLFLFSSQVLSIYCQTIPPTPAVSGSYRAIGELVQTASEFREITMQIAFEENFDRKLQKAAFTVWELGKNATYIENFSTGQTLQYDENGACKVFTPKDWANIQAPPYFLGYGDGKDIRFSVNQLLSLLSNQTFSQKFGKKGNISATYRGIPAALWEYQINSQVNNTNVTVALYSYWSIESWNTTSQMQVIPLGFTITKTVKKDKAFLDTDVQHINIFAFTDSEVNHQIFEPREGIYCEGEVKSEFNISAIPKINAMSIHSEIAVTEYLEVKSIDMRFDMKNKLLRVDLDRIEGQEPLYMKPGRKMTTEIISKELGATFSIQIYKGEMSCEVSPINSYKMEAQHLINPNGAMDINSLFGINSTTYRYIGKTTKRNIPCHMFQGKRSDWPDSVSPSVTLWEWCVATNLTESDPRIVFRDGEWPLVSLKIHFLNSTIEDFPTGSQLTHHFYDVLSEDPDIMYGSAFDINRCFQPDQKKRLQFTVNVNIDKNNLATIENATSDGNYLKQWRQKIMEGAKLSIGSLRVSRVRSTVYNDVLYVMFTLLDVHPSLPNKDKHKPLKDVEDALRKAIDGNNVAFRYFYQENRFIDLKAMPNSLTLVMDPSKIVHNTTTLAPPPTGTTPKVTGSTPKVTGSTAKVTGSTPKVTGSTPKVTGSTSKVTGSTPKVTGSTLNVTGSTPNVTGSTPNVTGSTPTGSTGSDNVTDKKQSTTPSGVSSTKSITDDTSKADIPGHSMGTVAGVTIVMLIIGIVAGAGGTFYKFKGTPSFLQRSR